MPSAGSIATFAFGFTRTTTVKTSALRLSILNPVSKQEKPMATTHTDSKRVKALNLRVRPEDHALIERAARARGKTRTDFIMDAVRQEAENILLDQAVLCVSPEAFAAFMEQLDTPAQPNEQLRKTLQD